MSRLTLSVAIIALVAFGMIPIVATTASQDGATSSPRVAQETVTIVARDSFVFEPSEVTVSPGQVVVVINEGFLQHDLMVDEWGIQTGFLKNGGIASFTVPDDAEPGTSVEFHCTVPGHAIAGQTGTFNVAAPDGIAPDPSGDGNATLEIEAHDSIDSFAYRPDQLEVYPGQEVRFTTSRSVLQHGLVVDAWDIDVGILAPDDQATFTVPDDAEVGSTVTFYCPLPGHRQAGMEGTFTVVAPPESGDRSAIDDLDATIAALEQDRADLSATATAIATQQAEIDEQIVTLEIQRDALIEATAEAEKRSSPTATSSEQHVRPLPARPTSTPQT